MPRLGFAGTEESEALIYRKMTAWSKVRSPAVTLREKENICAPALAFVFAWHRIGAIGAYEKQR
jgi:hypothetical protein